MLLKKPSGRRCFPGRWFKHSALALAIIALTGLDSLEAQSQTTWAPDVVAPGDLINLYADWPGDEVADAISIDVPAGWEVTRADAVSLGREELVPLTLRYSLDGVLAEAPHPLFGAYRFILTVRSPESSSTSSISVVPVSRSGETDTAQPHSHSRYEFEYDLRVERPKATSKKALRLNGDVAPLSVRRKALPDLADAEGFTVAFWLKTVERSSVVLSTWDGDSHSDYPFEFVIGADGEARVFAGRSGMHYSLGSSEPVADGTWRHLSLSVDFSTGQAILFVDGVEADARLLPDMSGIQPDRLWIGGRNRDAAVWVGSIDEIIILPSPRSEDGLKRIARLPATAFSQTAGALVLDFESRRNAEVLNQPTSDHFFIDSHLTLHEQVSNVVAEFQPGQVVLSWNVERPEKQEIVVERSVDGLRFEPIHRIELGELEIERMTGRELFRFEDFVSDEAPVLFYRIRQEFGDDAVLESQMIKVGIGALELPSKVQLLGNSPNPFSNTTEVTFRVEEPIPLRLSVWSLSGHLVEYLASETTEAGLHRIPFEAGNLPSGTYFVRLETEEGIQTSKMIVRR